MGDISFKWPLCRCWELNLDPLDFERLLRGPAWLHEVLYIAEAGLELMFLLHLLSKCCDCRCVPAVPGRLGQGLRCLRVSSFQWRKKHLFIASGYPRPYPKSSPYNWEQRAWDAVWFVWGTHEKPCERVSFWFCVKGYIFIFSFPHRSDFPLSFHT